MYLILGMREGALCNTSNKFVHDFVGAETAGKEYRHCWKGTSQPYRRTLAGNQNNRYLLVLSFFAVDSVAVTGEFVFLLLYA